MRGKRGFTLIEMMIVVATIAVLAAIAVPMYQMYVARSQLTAGLAEVSGGRTMFESQILANNITTFQLADIGLQSSTARCVMSMESSETGSIQCRLKGNPLVNGKTVQIARNMSGNWQCKVDANIPAYLWPRDCN
ncbi:pilin [Stenotrophomonas maltophilia]|uniref:Fimbrial protein pilin n=1 Tax=Stenotrophomonas maltophilia (strain R551-3) TaxID=391008 RepID=B4ST83_STRM5|nr:pilin [Stenotrophomonas maltophilia]ACF52874.1 Fimbrial protein pilin [Stenotrophomonas maltophilia R551-3]